jgi:2-polyprenyl-6-methoxyphenol hydroxylase-like FAD-dependent oxidoreductase
MLRLLTSTDTRFFPLPPSSYRIIDAWQVFVGTRQVADVRSGNVYGTTRGGMNMLLYEAAQQHAQIKIMFNHKLREINFTAGTLHFEVHGQEERVVVAAAQAKIVAADGVYSGVRRALETHVRCFFVSPSHHVLIFVFSLVSLMYSPFLLSLTHVYMLHVCAYLRTLPWPWT